MIEDVAVIPLRRIADERGTVFHMLRASDGHFREFGEIYFSSVHPGAVKGWHRHQPAQLNYACIVGTIKLVLYDDRDASRSRDTLMELYIGVHNYCLVQIPPGVWNGFTCVGGETAVVANCCSHVHGDFTSERLDPFDNDLPYEWGIKSG